MSRGETSGTSDSDEKVPWGEIVRSTPLRALAYVHFCNNWSFYVLLAWLPSCFTQELGVNLPTRRCSASSAAGEYRRGEFVGPLADSALERGVAPTIVRKAAQTVALCGPAAFMAAACFTDEPVFTVAFPRWVCSSPASRTRDCTAITRTCPTVREHPARHPNTVGALPG